MIWVCASCIISSGHYLTPNQIKWGHCDKKLIFNLFLNFMSCIGLDNIYHIEQSKSNYTLQICTQIFQSCFVLNTANHNIPQKWVSHSSAWKSKSRQWCFSEFNSVMTDWGTSPSHADNRGGAVSSLGGYNDNSTWLNVVVRIKCNENTNSIVSSLVLTACQKLWLLPRICPKRVNSTIALHQ